MVFFERLIVAAATMPEPRGEESEKITKSLIPKYATQNSKNTVDNHFVVGGSGHAFLYSNARLSILICENSPQVSTGHNFSLFCQPDHCRREFFYF